MHRASSAELFPWPAIGDDAHECARDACRTPAAPSVMDAGATTSTVGTYVRWPVAGYMHGTWAASRVRSRRPPASCRGVRGHEDAPRARSLSLPSTRGRYLAGESDRRSLAAPRPGVHVHVVGIAPHRNDRAGRVARLAPHSLAPPDLCEDISTTDERWRAPPCPCTDRPPRQRDRLDGRRVTATACYPTRHASHDTHRTTRTKRTAQAGRPLDCLASIGRLQVHGIPRPRLWVPRPPSRRSPRSHARVIVLHDTRNGPEPGNGAVGSSRPPGNPPPPAPPPQPPAMAAAETGPHDDRRHELGCGPPPLDGFTLTFTSWFG
ncbi:hypothetical protein DCS_00022 [Drechmeria coniospora]|uniref:Uncharacterized protein n=1 Tax=Drechmeria coniospora TaxID=98403 RepID=A0A151GP54_DRECN|nr:hypothetical protein DCS_00022 [Drechmeria coniospora]KYK58895.1 hypothetical protein DCS_00022 [Drechmeria coniospora]